LLFSNGRKFGSAPLVIAVVGPGIEKGFSRAMEIAIWAESGLCRFSMKPLFADHIQATKGKIVKKNTFNYAALQYGNPIAVQVQQQMGRRRSSFVLRGGSVLSKWKCAWCMFIVLPCLCPIFPSLIWIFIVCA
jgi:hypothetical protein